MVAMYNCLNGTCLSECGNVGNKTCAAGCQSKSPACNGWAATPLGPNGNGGEPTQ